MNGILLIDKPSGMTSRGVVDRVSRMINIKRIGHTGTLDPMATGVLVLCVGTATKIGELITSYDKEYIAEVTIGIETDTLDIEGTILTEAEKVLVTKDQVEETLKKFIGEIEQEVPLYSAIKINGRRLYNYARGNKEIELPKRMVTISSLSLLGDLEKQDNRIKFKILCHVSKGTYIRSLIRDIGKELGYPTCMSSLRRTRQGDFRIDDCYTLEDIANGNYQMIDVNAVLSDIKEMKVDGQLEKYVRNGIIIDKVFDGDMIKMVSTDGDLIAIYQTYDLDESKAKPYKMLL